MLICKFLVISFLNKVFTVHGKLINFLLEFCCVSSQSLANRFAKLSPLYNITSWSRDWISLFLRDTRSIPCVRPITKRMLFPEFLLRSVSQNNLVRKMVALKWRLHLFHLLFPCFRDKWCTKSISRESWVCINH